MDNKIKNALLLTWGEVSFYIGQKVSDIIGRKITCRSGYEDAYYWGAAATNDTFSVQELKNLLCYVNASKELYDEALPPDSDSSKSLGMGLSQKLLEKCIGSSWEHLSFSNDGLWLVGINPEVVNLPEMSPDTIYVEDCFVDTTKLISKDELMKYLENTEGTSSDLDEICQKNLLEYDTKLYWHCPIPSNDHEGYYFVLVREGVLSLPYNHIFDRNEEFALGDAELLDSRKIFKVKCDLDSFCYTTSRILDSLARHQMKRGGKK